MKNYILLTLILTLSLASAQKNTPASGDATQPKFPVPASRDSVAEVPLFRPKVVVHREVMIPKDPFLGGALSLVLPGVGQAYCGKWLKGIGFLAGSLLSYGISGGMNSSIAERTNAKEEVKTGEKLLAGSFAIIGLAIHGWSVIDGVNTANAHNRQLLGSP